MARRSDEAAEAEECDEFRSGGAEIWWNLSRRRGSDWQAGAVRIRGPRTGQRGRRGVGAVGVTDRLFNLAAAAAATDEKIVLAGLGELQQRHEQVARQVVPDADGRVLASEATELQICCMPSGR